MEKCSMRCFVAIDLPKNLRMEIKRYTQKYNKVKWSPREQMHITLRFMGEAKEDKIDDIKEALSRIEIPAFKTFAANSGFFPSPKSPSVFWIGIENCQELGKLKKDVDKALRPFGLLADRKSYVPHITLCRFKRGSHKKIVAQLQEHFAAFPETEIEVDSFKLYQSRLFRGNTEHVMLESFDLY